MADPEKVCQEIYKDKQTGELYTIRVGDEFDLNRYCDRKKVHSRWKVVEFLGPDPMTSFITGLPSPGIKCKFIGGEGMVSVFGYEPTFVPLKAGYRQVFCAEAVIGSMYPQFR